MASTIAQPVEKVMGRGVPTADAVVGKRGSTSSSSQLQSPNMRPETTSDEAAQVEETQSLAFLMAIVFGILGGALLGAILTVFLSWRS